MAGSSLPLTWRRPPLEYGGGQAVSLPAQPGQAVHQLKGGQAASLPAQPVQAAPLGVDLREALVVGYGGLNSYGFHALETLQCMVERRRGGETGVEAVQCLSGPAVWEAGEQG